MILVWAGLAVAGAAVAAAAPSSHSGADARGGPGTLGRSPAPSVRSRNVPRGGSGTLGQFYGRSPSASRVPRSYPYYPVPYHPYYDGFYGSSFSYDPFFYDPFYSDFWNQSYAPGYSSADEWSKRGNVQLQVDPKDVEVMVDGIPSARSGRAVLNLPAGMHHVEITHPGYRPWVLDLDVQQGVRYRLEQHLERLSKEEQESGADRPTTRRVGELRLNVRPADTIIDLDGRLLGMADLLRGSEALRRLPLGRHTLRFSHLSYKTVEKEIDITADRPTEVSVDLQRE